MTDKAKPIIQRIDIDLLVEHPDNPRIIRDDRFKQLVGSLKSFPEMLDLRPIIVNKKMLVLGGNKRLLAAKEAGMKQIPVMIVNLSKAKEKEFMIKDNVSFGDWDIDGLAKNWEGEKDFLFDWGLELPEVKTRRRGAPDMNDMSDQVTLSLHFTKDKHKIVKAQLKKIAATPEEAIWQLLGNNNSAKK